MADIKNVTTHETHGNQELADILNFNFDLLNRSVIFPLPKYPWMGMNYYHESMGYIARTDEQIDVDLDIIKTLTNRLKIYHNPLNSGNRYIADNICRRAKAKGFYVVWTENNDNTTLNDATWTTTYTPAVLADAEVALNAGADEFLIGNELSIHIDGGATLQNSGSNYVNYVNAMKALAASVSGIFTKTLSIQEVWGQDYKWGNNGGKGTKLSKIYFTVYEGISQFTSSVTNLLGYGTDLNAAIGEFSTENTMAISAGGDETTWATLIANRCIIIDGLGYTAAYPFTFREPSAKGFGFFDEGNDTPHLAWYSLFKW